jgi:tyrosyl-tRNA synthetase
MGRLEGNLTAAQILYPLMQCTDVFFLKADVCQLGVDQRKVNMLAREYCEAAKIKNKPIILSHHMLYGLKAGQEKMSKSDPDSAIFMEDATEDVERKIMNAFCPTRPEGKDDTVDVDDAGKESMHLVKDDIKNPCLDYIKNIIFSPPSATFSAGGITYADFETVKSKFLDGEISENALKRGLIDALNVLLEPVRDHFTSDENAKSLLALVQKYKNEASATVAERVVRRLNLVELGRVPAGSHLVFAPIPNANPSLQDTMDTLALLQLAGDGPAILYLSDWSARVCNACEADQKAIDAYYRVFTASLIALDPTTMTKVQILYQSEAILADPSNYWICVINVGRQVKLDKVMGPEMKDSDGAGWVVARLMKTADVAGVEPASVAFVDGTAESLVMSNLVLSFFESTLTGLKQPQILSTNAPSLLLQQRDSAAHTTENDEYFVLDDPKVRFLSDECPACHPLPILTRAAFASYVLATGPR